MNIIIQTTLIVLAATLVCFTAQQQNATSPTVENGGFIITIPAPTYGKRRVVNAGIRKPFYAVEETNETAATSRTNHAAQTHIIEEMAPSQRHLSTWTRLLKRRGPVSSRSMTTAGTSQTRFNNVTSDNNSNLTLVTPITDGFDTKRANLTFTFKGVFENLLACNYCYGKSLLTCQSRIGSIACNSSIDFAYLNKLSLDVLSFGLKYIRGDNVGGLSVKTELLKYKIYPFKLVAFNETTSTMEFDYVVPIYGYDVVSFMNSTRSNADDLACFNGLVALLNEMKLVNQMDVVNHVINDFHWMNNF